MTDTSQKILSLAKSHLNKKPFFSFYDKSDQAEAFAEITKHLLTSFTITVRESKKWKTSTAENITTIFASAVVDWLAYSGGLEGNENIHPYSWLGQGLLAFAEFIKILALYNELTDALGYLEIPDLDSTAPTIQATLKVFIND